MTEQKKQIAWVQGGRTLFTDSGPPFRIVALSPSDFEHTLFLNRISAQLAIKGEPHRAPIASDPNLAAIVLLLEWGEHAVLLGADLLADTDARLGWLAAVVEAGRSATTAANLVKIPHHGSASAHCPEMWTHLLVDKPYSVGTPFCGGKKEGRPPKKTDLQRISNLSTQTILTAPNQSGRARNARSAVSLGLSQSNIKIRSLTASIGMARFRRKTGSQWATELFGRARKI
jgi:hypothetical protein